MLLLSGGWHDHHRHEHGHKHAHRDNNMRSAVVHVMADAAVSILVIIGLVLARALGWLWMDPLAGLIGASRASIYNYLADARRQNQKDRTL